MSGRDCRARAASPSRPSPVRAGQRAASSRCRTAAIIAARSASFPSAAARLAPCRPMHVVDEVRRLGRGRHARCHPYRRRSHCVGSAISGARAAWRSRSRILRDVPALPRLRLSSLDCIEADTALLRCLGEEERLMPYLHLSLQAGDDLILKRMKRRHSRDDAVRFCETVAAAAARHRVRRRPHCGLPDGDGRHVRADARACADDCGLTHLHVFPFSAAAGTPAARMPAVPHATSSRNARRLRCGRPASDGSPHICDRRSARRSRCSWSAARSVAPPISRRCACHRPLSAGLLRNSCGSPGTTGARLLADGAA